MGQNQLIRRLFWCTPNGHKVCSSHIIWNKIDWLEDFFWWTLNGQEVGWGLFIVQSWFSQFSEGSHQTKDSKEGKHKKREKSVRNINAVLTQYNGVVLSYLRRAKPKFEETFRKQSIHLNIFDIV